MVLSNYKCMHIRIQGSWILIQGLQTYSSNVSSNRIKIQEILLILQLETVYFSKLFISEIHSKQWYYSLHRDFQNCYSTRRSLTRFFKLQFQLQFQLQSYTYTVQRILHAEDKELFEYYNSTHRRQGDLLEMHPCVLQDIPGNSSCSRDIPDIPVIHDLPAFPGNSTMFQYFQRIHPIPAFSD